MNPFNGPDPSGALFTSVRLGTLSLSNRVAVAPMTRTSANSDGTPTARMAAYYRDFAEGGFGLVISEGLYPDTAHSQGYVDQPGLATDEQAEGWRPVVAGVQDAGGRMVAQLMHAGALSQSNRFRSDTVGPSAVPPKGRQMPTYFGSGPYRLPRAMSEEEIREAIDGFAGAARRARTIAGFDGVEIHGANGYLIDQFLTGYTNLRTDEWGGSIAGRVRFLQETVKAVRKAVGPGFPVGVRISQAKVNDYQHRWSGMEEAEIIFSSVAAAGADYIHTTQFEALEPAWNGAPASLAGLARRFGGGLPVMANGGLHDPDAAAAMLAGGSADLVSLGRGALGDPHWPLKIEQGRAVTTFDPSMLDPVATLENADRVRSVALSGAG